LATNRDLDLVVVASPNDTHAPLAELAMRSGHNVIVDKPFTITLDNKDAGTPHDLDISDASGAKVFDGKDFPGPAVKAYDVPALKAGTYKFFCSIHPALMSGELTVGG
jgi:plastocyanin